jgi:hypothetical protein
LQIDDEAELRIKLASLMIAAQVVGATISAARWEGKAWVQNREPAELGDGVVY